ncbi:MAG: bifunctional oligoribonuclease/PAP phosphatase NrnA [Gemmatimonadetes bacterium]|nr:bifunctional oligoribonuclease/PAP phosphatase NrnA [Gemmatimonadota bacterium]
MSYRTPEHRAARVTEVADALGNARRVVLTTHINADGDGAGCEAALLAWLAGRGIEARIVNPTPFPEMFEFLLPGLDVVIDAKTPAAPAYCRSADLAVVVDTGEAPRVGRINPLISELPKVIIDHHQPGDSPLAGLMLVDTQACATGELLYDVISAAGGPWPQPVCAGLYVAIMTDTGSFRFSNSTPASHLIAADLLSRGVNLEDIFERVHATWPLRRIQLLRATLDELDTDLDHGLAWVTVPRSLFVELRATSEDLEGFVDYPRSIRGVQVAMLFRQTDDNHTKVSFRSSGPVDVNALAGQFGGGGHIKAAGAVIEGPVDQVRPAVIEAARAAVLAAAGPAQRDTPP